MKHFLNTPVRYFLILVAVGSLVANVLLYMRYQKAQDANPDVQTERIVSELSKSIEVPDEKPSVLTVVDKSKLADSEIAKKAQNGDKILLFQKSEQVIIYRPQTKKLVTILNLTKEKANPTGVVPAEPAQ